KGTGVLPLGVNCSVPFANRHPAAFADGNARSSIRLLTPTHLLGCLCSLTFARFVVVRQRAVKRILPGCEFHREVILAPRRPRIVVAAVVFRPGCVPAAGVVRDGIIRGRIFANPEHCGDDFRFPWETFAALYW